MGRLITSHSLMIYEQGEWTASVWVETGHRIASLISNICTHCTQNSHLFSQTAKGGGQKRGRSWHIRLRCPKEAELRLFTPLRTGQ